MSGIAVTDTEPISLSSAALQRTVAANPEAGVPCCPLWVAGAAVSDASPSKKPPTFRVASRIGRAVGNHVLIEAGENRVSFRKRKELRCSWRG